MNLFTGYQELGNGRSPNRDGRERESRRVAARPHDLRGLDSGSRRNLPEHFSDAYEASSPLRSSRNCKANQRPSRKTGGRCV